MVSKDQSIIMQVAAKIAADLTPKTEDVNNNIVSFVTAYDAVCEIMLNSQGLTPGAGAPAQSTDEQTLIQHFPEATPVSSGGFTVRIKGKQHGPIPDWLVTACQAKGVTEVWDNRDGLASNPKRPWFKSTSTDDAFWAPRGK